MKHKFLWVLILFLSACSAAVEPDGVNTPLAPAATAHVQGQVDSAANESSTAVEYNRRVEMEDDYKFVFSLGFDSIRPIYSPAFMPAAEAGLNDQELVLGIAWQGEAKAYPISVLRYREMVDDELAGIPTLITW